MGFASPECGGCAVEVLMLIGLVVINGLFAMSEIALGTIWVLVFTARKARADVKTGRRRRPRRRRGAETGRRPH